MNIALFQIQNLIPTDRTHFYPNNVITEIINKHQNSIIMSDIQGQSNLPLLSPEQNISLYSLQSNLLKIWTQKKVDKYYQNTMLAYMDDLDQQEAKLEIMRELQRMLQNKSQYNKIKEYIGHREEVLDMLDEMLGSGDGEGEYEADEAEIEDACESLDELRKINLKLCQCIFEMKDGLEARGLNANAICQGYNQLFKKLNSDNRAITRSYLKKYIGFGKGYDPFFLTPYERIQKRVADEDIPKCVSKLFKMNISYVYRLIKAKNEIVKCLSCTCLDDANLGSESKPKPKAKKQKQSVIQEESQVEQPNVGRSSTVERKKKQAQKLAAQNMKASISQPQIKQPPVLRKAKQMEAKFKKASSAKNSQLKLPKIESASISKDKVRKNSTGNGSRLTIKKKNGYNEFGGPMGLKSPHSNFKAEEESDDEIDAYRKKIIARKLKVKPESSNPKPESSLRKINPKAQAENTNKAPNKKTKLSTLSAKQPQKEKKALSYRSRTHRNQQSVQKQPQPLGKVPQTNKQSEKADIELDSEWESKVVENYINQDQSSIQQNQKQSIKFTGRIRRNETSPKRTKKSPEQKQREIWRYEDNDSNQQKSRYPIHSPHHASRPYYPSQNHSSHHYSGYIPPHNPYTCPDCIAASQLHQLPQHRPYNYPQNFHQPGHVYNPHANDYYPHHSETSRNLLPASYQQNNSPYRRNEDQDHGYKQENLNGRNQDYQPQNYHQRQRQPGQRVEARRYDTYENPRQNNNNYSTIDPQDYNRNQMDRNRSIERPNYNQNQNQNGNLNQNSGKPVSNQNRGDLSQQRGKGYQDKPQGPRNQIPQYNTVPPNRMKQPSNINNSPPNYKSESQQPINERKREQNVSPIKKQPEPVIKQEKQQQRQPFQQQQRQLVQQSPPKQQPIENKIPPAQKQPQIVNKVPPIQNSSQSPQRKADQSSKPPISQNQSQSPSQKGSPQTKKTEQQNSMVSSQSQSQKRQIQMKPGQIKLPDLFKFIQQQKVTQKNRSEFEIGSWKDNIQNKHSYLTKFFLNSELAAFGISTPRKDGDYHILYWGVVSTDTVTEFLFKKYTEYLEKYTALENIYIGSGAYQGLNFAKKGDIFAKKRSVEESKELQFTPFLSIECSNICFNQTSDMSHETFFSEQIEGFKQTNAKTCQAIGLANSGGNTKLLPSFTKFKQGVPNIVEVNKILQQWEADTYATSQEINTGQCRMIVMKQGLTIKKNEFYVRDGYFMAKGTKIYENTASKSVVFALEMEKQSILMFFGKKFASIDDFLKLCKMRDGQTEINFAFKMFTKQLYGRMKNKQFQGQGCYGNWDIDFIWQDQLKGVIIKDMPEESRLFGPENFYVAIYKADILLYGFQVNSNDFLF